MSSSSKIDKKLAKIYYSPKGYWRGNTAIQHLAAATGCEVSDESVNKWLKKQAIWQIYLPAPKYIPHPKFDVVVPNEVHQANLIFLPHDRLGRKTYKYALTVVDVASRYKQAKALTTKESAEVADAFTSIYKQSLLKWPKLLPVDPGCEFMGYVSKLMKSHDVSIKRGLKALHRSQGIVERFNRCCLAISMLKKYSLKHA